MRPVDPLCSSCVPEPRRQKALPGDRGVDLFGSARKATTEASQLVSMCWFATLASAPQPRFFECLRMCWFLGISIPKQAGKRCVENLARSVEKEEKIGVVLIISAFFWNGYPK